MSKIISELFQTAIESCQELRNEINDVRYAGTDAITKKELILFSLRGRVFLGVLDGRNADCVIGHSQEADKAIALHVLLDGDAVETHPCDIRFQKGRAPEAPGQAHQ